MTEAEPSCPPQVADYAAQVVAYVERAVGVTLTYDSETLPVLDHYLRQVPTGKEEALTLIVATAGAYFGEVVRRHIGGRWDLAAGDPTGWKFVLPTALSFVPARLTLAAITRSPADDEPDIDVPAVIRQLIDDALATMAEMNEETFYSLCGRLDALEHLHEVVTAFAAQRIAEQTPAEPPESEPETEPS